MKIETKDEMGENVNRLVISENIKMNILPNREHGFLVTGKEIARALGLNENSVKTNKSYHKKDLKLGVHFISTYHTVLWTYKGLLWYSQHMQGGFKKEMTDWYVKEMTSGNQDIYHITQAQMVSIMDDVCQIIDDKIRLSLAKKLLNI